MRRPPTSSAREFPETASARSVLRAIGGRGERTFSGIQQTTRGTAATTITAALDLLRTKRVVADDLPLSTKASRERRWRVADPALRFWLAFVEPALPDIDRGRGDLALARVQADFPTWRGRAIEPVVRDALGRLLPDADFPEVGAVGGWWPRNNTPEVDLVGAPSGPVASRIDLVGTIKWRADGSLTGHDVAALARDAAAVPGADVGTPLVAVCPAGGEAAGLSRVWTAADLLEAWP
jgi:hypothetical protein